MKVPKFKNLSIYLMLIFTCLFLIYFFEVIVPFAIAFVIAYLINPIKEFFDKFLNDILSSLFSVMFFIFCLFSVLIIISPILIEQIKNLVIILPTYFNKFEILINELNSKYFLVEKIKDFNYFDVLRPLTENIINTSNGLFDKSVQFFNSFFNVILVFILSFYMSLEFNKIKIFFKSFEAKSNLKDFSLIISEIDIVLSKFIRGQGLICLILSFFYSTGLFIIGIEFGILLGLFAGMISFVPYVGSILGGGLTLILGFFQFGLSIELFFLLGIFLSGQLLESYYLTPKFVGNAIGLNPIWIIFAMLAGGHLAGFVGVLLSLPMAAIIGIIIKHFFIKIFNTS